MRSAVVFLAGLALAAAAGPSWHIVDSDIATIDTGVAFTSDTVGYAGGASNGVGPQVFKSTNGGVNWVACNTNFGIDILLLDTDAALNTVVISGALGELYSDNAGESFQPSTGGGTSQSVRYIGVNGDGGLKFGVTGEYFSVNGAGISVDGGKTFKAYDAKMTTDARYGAFPTDNTWYVAGGEWPGEGSDDDPTDDDPQDLDAGKVYRARKTVFQKPNGYLPRKYTPRKSAPAPTNPYQAQITKTTDGGNTWTTVFNDTGNFYFNAIDCQPSNENWCCAVGEADTDSPTAGARIHCTQDGGSSWNRTFWMPATSSMGFSIMEIRYATDDDVWAVGGELGELAPSAWFLYSGDGGLTWTHGTPPIADYYAIGLSFVDPTHAFAAMLDVITQSSAIAAYD